MTMPRESHPRREMIWRELHARPYVRFSAPAHVLQISFLSAECADGGRAGLARLREELQMAATYEAPRHCILAVELPLHGRLIVCWEFHTEFVRFTFFLHELKTPFEPFGLDLLDLLPDSWLAGLKLLPLVATRIEVAPRNRLPGAEEISSLFEGHTVTGSRVMGGRAEAWSCFRILSDGFDRIVLGVDEVSPHGLGRTVERLLDIGDFYHLVLLARPVAGDVGSRLTAAERRMVTEMDAVREARTPGEKRKVLDALLSLAVDVEHLRALVADSFSASAAYFSLLEARFSELREEKIEHVLRLSRFVMRRVKPAAEAYRSISVRLDGLSGRIDRAAELLRTGISLDVEEQNQRLLAAADQRSRLQLRMQSALESLSVVVIAYYALGLASYALKGAKSLGAHLDLDAWLGMGLPVVVLAVWAAVHGIRKRFQDRT